MINKQTPEQTQEQTPEQSPADNHVDNKAAEPAGFEEFDLDDIEVIESKVFA